MEDEEFVARLKAKLESLTGGEVVLHLGTGDQSQIKVELGSLVPVVTIGSNALQYSGFARMALEHAVASIRGGKELESLEFQVLLSRN